MHLTICVMFFFVSTINFAVWLWLNELIRMDFLRRSLFLANLFVRECRTLCTERSTPRKGVAKILGVRLQLSI